MRWSFAERSDGSLRATWVMLHSCPHLKGTADS